jgi:hypothetical protein
VDKVLITSKYVFQIKASPYMHDEMAKYFKNVLDQLIYDSRLEDVQFYKQNIVDKNLSPNNKYFVKDDNDGDY